MIYSNVKRIAERKGITIYRIEKDAKLGNGTISGWRKSSPSLTTLKKVADYLEVNIDELIREEDKKNARH